MARRQKKWTTTTAQRIRARTRAAAQRGACSSNRSSSGMLSTLRRRGRCSGRLVARGTRTRHSPSCAPPRPNSPALHTPAPSSICTHHQPTDPPLPRMITAGKFLRTRVRHQAQSVFTADTADRPNLFAVVERAGRDSAGRATGEAAGCAEARPAGVVSSLSDDGLNARPSDSSLLRSRESERYKHRIDPPSCAAVRHSSAACIRARLRVCTAAVRRLRASPPSF